VTLPLRYVDRRLAEVPILWANSERVSPERSTWRRTWRADEPLRTQTAHPKGGHHALISAWMVKHFGGVVGCPVDQPAPTQTCRGTQNQLVAALLAPYYGATEGGAACDEPMQTITTKDRHAIIQAALQQASDDDMPPMGFWRVWDFLIRYAGEDAPAPIVVHDGHVCLIVDIGMRMLQPRELYRAMGFPDDYVVDRYMDADGKVHKLTKTASVRMCGNSVPVDPVAGIIRANVPSREAVTA